MQRVTEKWREDIEKGVMPDHVVKAFDPKAVEVATDPNPEVRKASFVVSTADEDRDNDVIDQGGWDLGPYRKAGAPVLWAHQTTQPPIARAEEIGVQGGRLRAVTVFPEKGVYPFADTIFGLVKGGFIKGTSVGFHPIEAEQRKGKTKGVHFKRMELMEFSILPIPSNREALLEAKSAGHDITSVVKWAEAFLDQAQDSGLWIPRFQIEKAIKAILPLQVTVPAMPSVPDNAGSEGHAIAGAALSDDEVKGLVESIEKGDSPGHPFRGNQYTDGTGQDDGDASSDRPALRSSTGARAFDFVEGERRAQAMSDDALAYARDDANKAREAQRGMTPSYMGKDEGYYTDEAATYGTEQATRSFMRSTPSYSDSPSKNAETLRRMAKLIEERVKPNPGSPAAALAHWILRGRTASGANPFTMREPFENAARSMSKTLTEHLDSLNRSRKEAVAALVKGDVEGHPFRGNQWTDGSGGGEGGKPETHQGVVDASPNSAKPPAPKADPDLDQATTSAAHAANIHGQTAYLFRGPENTGPVHVRFSDTHPEPGWTKIGEVKPVPAGGAPTKYDRTALGHRITEQDTKDSGKRGFNPYALPQMLAAADRVDEAVKGGLDPSRAFAAEFNPTRGNHSIARKLGLHLTVERGQWVVRPEAGPAPKGYRGEHHVRDQSLATGARRGTFPGLKGYDGDYYEGEQVRQKEADMDDVISKVADELFGVVTKGTPPWLDKEKPAAQAPAQGAPAAAAPAAAPAPEGEGDEGAEGEAEDADKGQTPGGDPTEQDPKMAGLLDTLAQTLLAEIEPLKAGGDPTQVATALKTALEKFAAGFMQTYAGAPNPNAATPAAAPPPPAKPPVPGAKPPVPPPPQKGAEVDIEKILGSLDEADLREIIVKATKTSIADARRHLSGRLPD